MKVFTAEDALIRANLALEKGSLSKGKVIDKIKTACDRGETVLNVDTSQISQEDISEFRNERGFTVTAKSISWTTKISKK